MARFVTWRWALVGGSMLFALQEGQAQTKPFITINSVSVDPGAMVTVDLGYGEKIPAGSLAIYQLQGSLQFDAGALSLVSAVPQGGVDQRVCSMSAGRVDFDFTEFMCVSTPIPIPSGPLCRVTLSAAAIQATRNPRVLDLTLTSCDDGVGAICKDGKLVRRKNQRVCDAFDGAITVRQALYTSLPAADGRIEISAPVGGSASTNLEIRNDGTFSMPVNITAGSVPIDPAAFTLAPAAIQLVQVGCNPVSTATQEQGLTAGIGNDPDRAVATYTVACTGTLTPEREVVDLTKFGNGGSFAPVTDASGRYVFFQSDASNFVPQLLDTNGSSDIFRHDTVTGAVERVSIDTNEGEVSGASIEPTVAAGGGLVAFVTPESGMSKYAGESKAASDARRKSPGYAVALRNMLTGATHRVAGALPGGIGSQPVFAADGEAMVYTAVNTDAGQGAIGQENVYIAPLIGEDRIPGLPECVSCKSRSAMGFEVGNTDGPSGAPVISADGTRVVYETKSTNALAASTSPCAAGSAQIVLHNLVTGLTQRLSPPPGISPLNCGSAGSTQPSTDYPAGVVAFASDDALTPGDVTGISHVFVYDLNTDSMERISEPPDGSNVSSVSRHPVVSGDGRSVAFVSEAVGLDEDFEDTNTVADVHARRRDRIGGLRRLSRTVIGGQSNGPMHRPWLDYSGLYIAFDSEADNLILDDGNGVSDVFRRRLPANVEVLFYSGFE